jgi:flagellar hook-length control protein FliK
VYLGLCNALKYIAFGDWHRPCIDAGGSFRPPEVELSTHLSIAYSANAAAGSAPAASSGVAASASGSATASGGSPGNFLAALIDQLLAGAAAQTAAATTTGTAADGTAATTATATVPNLLNIGLDTQAATSAGATPQGNVLLAKLTEQLKALQDQLAKGEQPDPDLLNKLGETAEALAALIAKPSVSTSTSATLDPLATLKSVKSDGDNKVTADIPGADASKPAATPDQITQLLAAIGIQLPQAPTTATPDQASADTTAVTASAAATPLPSIAQLATQLSQLSQTIAASSPEVAQKLDALMQKLNAAETDPSVLAQLTTPDDSGANSLDKLVQSLLAAKPASTAPATPQLASNIQLQTPTAAQPAGNQLPPPPVANITASGTTQPAPKLAEITKPGDTTSRDSATSSADARIVAAATTQADPKADSPDTVAQANAAAVAAPAATQTVARAIPAAYQAATSPINMAQVAFEMVRQAHQGQSRFSIRIDPPELGRVDVRMHVDASGNVNARLTVERSETLDMFQRDRGSLEKALTQAGLDGAKTNLEFSLKQNPFAGMAGYDQRPSNGNSNAPRFALDSADAEDASMGAIPSVTLYRGMASSGGVNLFV